MDIIITKHAIKRYRERLFDFNSADNIISNILRDVARKGKLLHVKPGGGGQCFEVKYKGISVVLYNNGTESVIITCLGDAAYRKWIKNQEALKPHGRLLYHTEKNRKGMVKILDPNWLRAL